MTLFFLTLEFDIDIKVLITLWFLVITVFSEMLH